MKRCASLLVGLCLSTSALGASDPPAPVDAHPPAAEAKPRGGTSPEDALQRLIDGNDRYRYEESTFPRYGAARRAETFAHGQRPIAAVLACADSRAPVEAIFDQGIGDLFVIRVAGNVADTDEIGTIEYGVGHLEIPLIIVLGHTRCGAVTAVADNADVHGHIASLVDNIAPAVATVRARDPQAAGNRLIRLAIRANVMQSMQDLLSNSSAVASAVKAGKVKVVGGVYDLQTGGIDWLGSHPRESELVERRRQAAPAPRPTAGHEEPGHHPTETKADDHTPVHDEPQAADRPHASGRRQENWTALIALLSISTLASGATIHYAYGRPGK